MDLQDQTYRRRSSFFMSNWFQRGWRTFRSKISKAFQ